MNEKKEMDYILNVMKMDRRGQKELTRMGKKMDYGLCGMRMGKNRKKVIGKIP